MSKKADNSWVLVGKDGRTHDLSHGMIFIGREECDIVLQAASADKRHAVLCYNNGEQKFHIKDLNSLTGTYVNGIRIPEQTYVKLKRLDCIRFGYGPDVFYLEKSSSATSPSKEEVPKFPEKEDIKSDAVVETSKSEKLPLKLDESSVKKTSHSSELPSLTREDNPPDTLPLNLPNNRQQDKDWDWIGQDGALSDSPDKSISFKSISLTFVRPDVFYLEKSSSATSPSKEEVPKFPEKEDIKSDAVVETSKSEKLPLKLDESSVKKTSHSSELPSLTREDNPPDTLPLNLPNNRQQDKDWDWIGQDGALSDSPDYSQRSETSSCSAPPNCGTTTGDERDTGSAHSSPAATAFTIAFETEANTPRKKLGIRDSISKFAPNKLDSENRVSFQKNSKTEPSPKKLPLTDAKPPIPKARTQFGTADLKDINEEIGKITDSTSFLIKKMLNGEISPEAPEELNNKEKHHPTGQNDVDERSEAGTYTVETEQADCDVEEARKKIDEVFGVIQLSNSVQSSSYSSSTTSSSNKQIPRLNGRLKQPILKTSINPKQRESGMNWSSTGKTYGRTRGQGPTPAASTESLNHSDTLPRSLQRTRKISDPPSTPDRTRRAKLASSPKSPGKAKTPSTLKSPGSLSNNLSAAPSSRESLNRDEMTRRHSTDSRSEGSKSPHTSVQWQKVPWNLSGSDLDLDRSKSENNSILSDTSTEPSSHSSHSGQGRPDQGPQMRLNRAFALRRARLEAESGKKGKENRTSTASSQPKPMKKSGKLSSSTSTLRDDSSSGGGGSSSSKMSFRLSSNITKPFAGRQLGPQCSDPLKRKIVSSHNMDDYQCRSSSKEITALDSLVISAIHQLASKLWSNSKHLLERERKKCPKGSDTWLMIDEVLPQGPVTGTPEDGDFTKDLSSILKNLKRVEQGLDVLSSILENGHDPEPGVNMQEKAPLPQNFFVVNM
ncbi:centrosomal protein of 170 kDa protein B [Nephila pilipes]|uniref:Centrosomal protein of 170 kDa protein B n=1 Tax=Nephila pilipes TaxID=299642 RepID=A0A8X6N5H5_NEPPI|nr:centrosomal protein of 170 kDa protein B [Nephila pilipes]